MDGGVEMSIKANAVEAAWRDAETNDEALQNLLRSMDTDPEIYRAIMDPHKRMAAMAAIGEFRRARRAYIWNRGATVSPLDPSARSRANAVGLLDMRLPNGRELRDATRDEVREAAQGYREREACNGAKAAFLEAVESRMIDGQTVGEALSESELQGLRNAA